MRLPKKIFLSPAVTRLLSVSADLTPLGIDAETYDWHDYQPEGVEGEEELADQNVFDEGNTHGEILPYSADSN